MLSVEGLIHKPFNWGYADCYSMLMGIYDLNFGIKLTNFARPTGWRADAIDLILRNYERDGWMKLTTWKPQDLRPGDVIVVSVNESNPNHFIVYLGDNQVAHHFAGRLSSTEELASFWLHAAAFVLRHPDVPDLRPQLRTASIQELLLERHRPKAR